jgi:phage/plasmid-associated DNA primase
MKLSTEVFDEVEKFAAVRVRHRDGRRRRRRTASASSTAWKSVNQKELILRECGDLFYRQDFERDLDENKHLLGFENGVFDLYAGEFREGAPKTWCPQHGRQLRVRAGDHVLEEEIMDFFQGVP